MKLQTTIIPRADGTVVVRGDDGKKYVFQHGDDGILECDVTCKLTAARLLGTGDFFPLDEGDFSDALALTASAQTQTTEDGQEPGASDLDDPVNLDALPVEANTPPAPKAAAKAAKAGK